MDAGTISAIAIGVIIVFSILMCVIFVVINSIAEGGEEKPRTPGEDHRDYYDEMPGPTFIDELHSNLGNPCNPRSPWFETGFK